jgi:hypothetical protein
MKHQIVHALQKYVLNPPIKLVFAERQNCPSLLVWNAKLGL